MKFPALLFLRAGRQVICALFGTVLTAAGVLHMVKLHFTYASLIDNPREYLLHCVAGLLFGWIFAEGMFAYARDWLTDLRRNFLPVSALAVISPVIFLVVIHQTRYFLNDGPATLAMAAALMASGVAAGRGAALGIKIPASFLALIEAGKMDGEFSIGIVKSLHAMDQYSPRLFGVLSAIHRRQGNGRKAECAAQVAALLSDEADEK